MTSKRLYKSAPIKEAIIDIRVSHDLDVDLDKLSLVMRGDTELYPNKQALHEAVGTLELELGKSATASASQRQIGFAFSSSDKKNICQLRQNGFSFSRLAPYESWDPFCREAQRLWNKYQEVVASKGVIRLAVRFINKIDIPGDAIELEDYLQAYPQVPGDWTKQIQGFFVQIRSREEAIKGNSLVNLTNVKASGPGILSVLLDIDLFRDEEVPQSEHEIWSTFPELRDRKNEIFESCITDKTRGLFD